MGDTIRMGEQHTTLSEGVDVGRIGITDDLGIAPILFHHDDDVIETRQSNFRCNSQLSDTEERKCE